MWAKHTQRGFTIVELLVVIVIIGILAAVMVGSYRGIQDRTRYSVMKQDLSSVHKALEMYYADNGRYPYSGAAAGNITAGASASLSIPGLVPDYMSKTPTVPNDGKGGYYTYIWSANGVDYKLVRLATSSANLPSVEAGDPNPDTARSGRGWGYWSSGGSAL